MFYVDQLDGTRKLRDVSKRLEVELEAFEAGRHVRLVGPFLFSQAVFVGFLRSSVHHFLYIQSISKRTALNEQKLTLV